MRDRYNDFNFSYNHINMQIENSYFYFLNIICHMLCVHIIMVFSTTELLNSRRLPIAFIVKMAIYINSKIQLHK